MARLRTITRTGAFSWNPDSGIPLLVTGTKVGAVDADFSDETKLELWDLSLDDPDQSVELQPIASYSTDSRFHDIAWSPPNADHPRGIIAGALENGSLYLWDAEKFINQKEEALISQTKKHTGPIKSLQFNPLKPQILATAGTKGELFIYDINDISNPFRLGTSAARSDDLECIAWNRKVPHILATGGTGGFVTVWDLKTKKASLTLNNNRKSVGAIAWDPDHATILLTATPDDSSPVILLWDLRNSNAPECTLHGHNQGVLSISWCEQDSSLLLSSGKDNRTILWNPQAGELLGEFPEATNWTFQTRFHPHNPALSASASFDGKICVQTLYNTNSILAQPKAQIAVDGEDFFAKVQTQPQAASFSLKKAPKWCERPCGASFGFGGKLVSFSRTQDTAVQQRRSKVQIVQYSIDNDIESSIREFEEARQKGDLKSICQNHILQATSDEEKANWKAIDTLLAEDPRKRIVDYLKSPSIEPSISIETHTNEEKAERDPVDNAEGQDTKKNRLSTLFADGTEGEDFLSNISSTKGAKTDNPFHLISDSDSDAEKQISQALILGQYEKAMSICLGQNRIADALIIANCGGKSLLEKAQSSYLSKKTEGPNYLRILTAIIGKNLWDIVYNADLANWKEVMVTLCSYADSNEFPDLCEALGDRIMDQNQLMDASFCYLVGSKLEKVIPIWLTQLEETEKTEIEKLNGDSLFSIHARTLQTFIEKVTIFRDVTKFQDTEQNMISDWKLSCLYAKYIEYADIATAHGHLETAEGYLSLLPAGYPTVDIERTRLKLASNKIVHEIKRENPQQASTNHKARPTTVNPYNPKASATTNIPARTSSNAYAPHEPAVVGNPYLPMNNYSVPKQQSFQPTQINNYGPDKNYDAASTSYGAPVSPLLAQGQRSVPAAPPPRAKDVGQWNDTPMVVKPSTARRSTPSIRPNPVPFSNQQNIMSVPSLSSQYGTRPIVTPPPPPPKGSAPSQLTSPPTGPSQQYIQRPSSVASQASYNASVPHGSQGSYGPPVSHGPHASYSASVPHGSQGAYGPPVSNGPPVSHGPQASYSASVPHGSQGAYGPPVSNGPPVSHGPQAPYSASVPHGSQGAYGPPVSRGPQASYSASVPHSAYGPPVSRGPQGAYGAPVSHVPQDASGPLVSNGPPVSHGPQASYSASVPQVNLKSQSESLVEPPIKGSASTHVGKVGLSVRDPSSIPPIVQRIIEILSQDMQRVASQAPSSFAPQVKDTQKRLNILFDHLNNQELVKTDTIQKLDELAEALSKKNYDLATKLQLNIQKEKIEECGNWMVGVKRLISMSKVTP